MSQFAPGRALIVGVGTYQDTTLDAPVTAREARAVAAALRDPRIAAYPSSQVQLKTDGAATRAECIAALQALARETLPTDTVLIFFSGHGNQDENGAYCLGTHDVQRTPAGFQSGTGISQNEFLTLLRNIKPRKLVVILNTCFSGALSPTLAGANSPALFTGTAPNENFVQEILQRGEGQAIITASRPSQASFFDWKRDYTYFGQALIDGLNGQGVTARGGYIGLFELYDYIYQQVGAAAAKDNVVQEPMLTLLQGVGPFPIAHYRGASPQASDAAKLQAEPKYTIAVQYVQTNVTATFGDNATGNLVAGGDITVGSLVVNKYERAEPETKPKRPALFSRAWLPYMAQYERFKLVLYMLVLLLALLTLSACAGVPQVEGWKPISTQYLGGDAKWITRIGETLFVMTSTNEGCDESDTGLWRSSDHGKNWERISVPALDVTTGKCDRSKIEAIVASTENPKKLYATTASVGLIVSDNNGTTWDFADKDSPLRQLGALAVLGSPERLYIVSRVADALGLYRSVDGKQWERLNERGHCKKEKQVTLPTAATLNASLLIANGLIYIAPGDSPSPGAAPEGTDLYYSSDGGDCWQSVHAINGAANYPPSNVNYSAITAVPGMSSIILFATWDRASLQRKIWKRDWATGQVLFLGNVPIGISQIFIAQDSWYATTPLGLVFRGKLNTDQPPERLFGPISLYAAMTSDFDNGAPLLLSGGRVFRRGVVGWFQGFLP